MSDIDRHWAEVGGNELRGLLEHVGGSKVSMSRVHRIASLAIAHHRKFYKYFVKDFVSFCKKAQSDNSLALVYVLDGVIRIAGKKLAAKSEGNHYPERFSNYLYNIFPTFLSKSSEEDVKKITKVVLLWKKQSIFGSENIESVLELIETVLDHEEIVQIENDIVIEVQRKEERKRILAEEKSKPQSQSGAEIASVPPVHLPTVSAAAAGTATATATAPDSSTSGGTGYGYGSNVTVLPSIAKPSVIPAGSQSRSPSHTGTVGPAPDMSARPGDYEEDEYNYSDEEGGSGEVTSGPGQSVPAVAVANPDWANLASNIAAILADKSGTSAIATATTGVMEEGAGDSVSAYIDTKTSPPKTSMNGLAAADNPLAAFVNANSATHGPVAVGAAGSGDTSIRGPPPPPESDGSGEELVLVKTRTLWIGNLDGNVTEKDLRSIFEPYTRSLTVLLKGNMTMAFVTFQSRAEAEKAKAESYGKTIGACRLKVGWGFQPHQKKEQQDYKNGTVVMARKELSPEDSLDMAGLVPPMPPMVSSQPQQQQHQHDTPSGTYRAPVPGPTTINMGNDQLIEEEKNKTRWKMASKQQTGANKIPLGSRTDAATTVAAASEPKSPPHAMLHQIAYGGGAQMPMPMPLPVPHMNVNMMAGGGGMPIPTSSLLGNPDQVQHQHQSPGGFPGSDGGRSGGRKQGGFASAAAHRSIIDSMDYSEDESDSDAHERHINRRRHRSRSRSRSPSHRSHSHSHSRDRDDDHHKKQRV